jgi:hypothetical protein
MADSYAQGQEGMSRSQNVDNLSFGCFVSEQIAISAKSRISWLPRQGCLSEASCAQVFSLPLPYRQSWVTAVKLRSTNSIDQSGRH